MPTVDIGLFDHLVFLILAVAFPLHGRQRFQSLRNAIAAGEKSARVSAYRIILAEEWIVTAIVAVGWLVLNRGGASLGLIAGTGPLALVGYGLALVLIAILLMDARAISRDVEKHEKVLDAFGDTLALIPHSSDENTLFKPVAITAGICEEFLYRGFLLSYLAAWLPTQPTWLVVLAGSVVFGFAHLYQGPRGILKTGAVGLLMGGLYWMTGSIWASVVLHAFIDLNSGWIGWRVVREMRSGDSLVPAAE